MSLAVVRCPGCHGASRVSIEALGHMVGCPRCEVPFVAEEEIPVVQPVGPPSAPRAAAAVPVAPRRRPQREPEPESESGPSPADSTPEIPDPEHDPHLPPPAGLPVSVLVGLALLPFAIPLLWFVAPLITGQAAALSLAVPISLAVAASALCLGVVYTIDWTATTRIKGVLMLVGLAYLSAAGLFFLKKDLMDRVQDWGSDPHQWNNVASKEGNCQVQMPVPVKEDKTQEPWVGMKPVAGWKARLVPDPQEQVAYDYWFAVSALDQLANKPDDVWFDRVRDQLKKEYGEPTSQTDLRHQNMPEAPGRQWTFERDGGKTARVVQVFVIKGRAFFLSAEGPKLTPTHEEYGAPFFGNFFVNIN
jgi:hypothetical protein